MPNKQKVYCSSIIFDKSRCKYCLSLPYYYFYIRCSNIAFDYKKNILSFDVSKRLELKKKTFDKFYSYGNDKVDSINSTRWFSHSVNYKGVTFRLFKNKTNPAIDYVELFSCKCNRTSWTIYQKGAKNRPEITNKRYKNKFIL